MLGLRAVDEIVVETVIIATGTAHASPLAARRDSALECGEPRRDVRELAGLCRGVCRIRVRAAVEPTHAQMFRCPKAADRAVRGRAVIARRWRERRRVD